MAASFNMFPGGAEFDDDFDDDNFVFGTDDIESDEDFPKFHKPSNRIEILDEKSNQSFAGRGGFGAPPQKSKWKQSPKKEVQRKETKKERKVYGMDDFRMAVIRGNLDVIKDYIEQGINPNIELKCGWTPLMYGANSGNPDLVKYLLQAGANTQSHKDMYTVLMAACASTCVRQDDILACVSLLLDQGADVNAHDRYHMSPLIYAAREGRVKVVEKLVDKGAHINKQDHRGWTALSWAVSKNHKDVVQLLINKKADIKKKHCDGQTALDLAVYQDLQEMIGLLGGEVSSGSLPRVQQFTSSGAPKVPSASISQNNHLSSVDSGGDQQAVLKYGELELFLCGLDLSDYVTIFQEQCVDFATFLRMSEADLINMGIHQIGVRKKILDGIHSVHRKEWEVSSLTTTHHNKEISCVHAVAMVSNICKHTKYIASTIGYIGDRVTPNSQMIEPQDGASAKQLSQHCRNMSENVRSLQRELDRLNKKLSKILSEKDLDPPDMVQRNKLTRSKLNYKRLSTSILLTGTMCVVIYKWDSIKTQIGRLLQSVGGSMATQV